MTVLLLALLSATFFGLGLVLTHRGLRRLTPLAGAAVSIPTSTAIFIALSPFTIDFAQWNATSALIFALVGLLYPAAVTLLTFEANRRIGPNLTGALGNLTPLFAVLIASIVLEEIPNPLQLAGIALIAAGLAALFYDPGASHARLWTLAMALPLAAALVRGLTQPVVKLGLEGWPNPFAASLIGYLVSAAVVLTATRLSPERPRGTLHGNGRWWFAAVGFCNGGAVLTMYAALARGTVAQVAPLVACYPIVTLLAGRFILRTENFSYAMALGIGVTIVGIGLLIV
jgi:drug/metabolite transporter (DMT)-like permease